MNDLLDIAVLAGTAFGVYKLGKMLLSPPTNIQVSKTKEQVDTVLQYHDGDEISDSTLFDTLFEPMFETLFQVKKHEARLKGILEKLTKTGGIERKLIQVIVTSPTAIANLHRYSSRGIKITLGFIKGLKLTDDEIAFILARELWYYNNPTAIGDDGRAASKFSLEVLQKAGYSTTSETTLIEKVKARLHQKVITN